ncbi:MAG: ATP phosphoribosyltransferase regulatory subunit [Firmicutes bacterium]|nr:ATP phosphoribosyltransferase regulatory subunit [Bacillota bacterium]
MCKVEQWLRANRRQYEVFVQVVEHLLASGFHPVSTDLYRDHAFRRDHTEAMVQVLGSFEPASVPWPLKVFSTGPLFRAGQAWLEAVDVEWLGEPAETKDADVVQFLVDLVSGFRLEARDLVIVFGHLGWLQRVLDAKGIGESERRQAIEALRQGCWSWISSHWPDLVSLFRPLPPSQFVEEINRWIEPIGLPAVQTPWTERWDLSLTGQWDYYHGIVFSLYHRATGQALANGGRFEMRVRDRAIDGIGFTLYLDAFRAVEG